MPSARLIERNGCLFDRPWRGRSPSGRVWCSTTFFTSRTLERPPRSSTFCTSTTLVTIRPPFLLNLYRTGESGRQRELLDWSGNGGAVHCQGGRCFVAIPLNQTLFGNRCSRTAHEDHGPSHCRPSSRGRNNRRGSCDPVGRDAATNDRAFSNAASIGDIRVFPRQRRISLSISNSDVYWIHGLLDACVGHLPQAHLSADRCSPLVGQYRLGIVRCPISRPY